MIDPPRSDRGTTAARIELEPLEPVGEHDPRSSDELLARLSTAQGHLKAVVNMVTRGAPPEEILAQLWSVEAALSAAGRRLLSAQMRNSTQTILRAPSMQERSQEAERLARIVSLAAQHTSKSHGWKHD
jgi:DNA-binding FrmR family transcriptional regulator